MIGPERTVVGTRGEHDRIRVLIVDDNHDTQDNLAKMLYFERDIEVVGAASGGREGIEKAHVLTPHVVLMDINMPDMDGIRATEAIRHQVPGSQVIIMSVQGEQDYLRRAMIAGASDYLVKPFGGDELANSIRTVYRHTAQRPVPAAPQAAWPTPTVASSPPEQRSKLVAIYSPKGGVGRTTIAVNLATALQMEMGARVVLLDCSLLFGDVGVMLNLTANRTIVDLIPYIEEPDEGLLENFLLPHSSGLRVLLCPPRPELAELVTADHMGKLLARLRRNFEYVIVDTAPTLGEVTLSVLDNADRILVVTTLEMPALKNMKLFLDTVDALGYPPDRTALVINRADSSGGIRVQDVEDRVRQKVLAQVVNDWKTATFATNRGTPFVMNNRDSQIARNVMDLARALSGPEARSGAPESRSGMTLFRFR